MLVVLMGRTLTTDAGVLATGARAHTRSHRRPPPQWLTSVMSDTQQTPDPQPDNQQREDEAQQRTEGVEVETDQGPGDGGQRPEDSPTASI